MGGLNPANFPLQRPVKQKQKIQKPMNIGVPSELNFTDVGHKTRYKAQTWLAKFNNTFSELPTNHLAAGGSSQLVTEPTNLPSDSIWPNYRATWQFCSYTRILQLHTHSAVTHAFLASP
jgi:hypothetical protein